ncbi:hypothetical protein TWF730_011219 [Orbilia blumenaviensis]|uniref:Uncharacterized protein n=1 Tax=Orbilia blumenaviensis TaxID=1796055 RepID=A0AAV9UJU5_9PEZI
MPAGAKRIQGYARHSITDANYQQNDIQFLIGKVVTGWEPWRIIPEKYSTSCILFTIKNESPIVVFSDGPKFSRDVTFDADFFASLPGNSPLPEHQAREIVEAKWALGDFFYHGSNLSSQPAKVLALKFKGMQSFGYIWSEFFNDGRYYASSMACGLKVLPIERFESESLGLAFKEDKKVWTERRNLQS